jgi:hypothetical protein
VSLGMLFLTLRKHTGSLSSRGLALEHEGIMFLQSRDPLIHKVPHTVRPESQYIAMETSYPASHVS